MAERVITYFDGFNFYHALDELRKDYLKWVNLWSLSGSFLKANQELIQVKYFSAYAKWHEEAYRRHQVYVRALRHYNVLFIEGRFNKKHIRCLQCKCSFQTHEEKETDVNIAIHLLRDALQDNFDRAIIVSADTDLLPAIKMARQTGKRVDVFAPPGRMKQGAKTRYEIYDTTIAKHLLPAQIPLIHGRVITRPLKYALPALAF